MLAAGEDVGPFAFVAVGPLEPGVDGLLGGLELARQVGYGTRPLRARSTIWRRNSGG